MYITYSIHSFFFFFFFFLGMGGVRGWWARGDVWICFFLFVFSKILPETKSKLSSSQCTLFPPPSLPKDRGEEKCAKVPRSHWKGKIKNVLLIFSVQLLYVNLFMCMAKMFCSTFRIAVSRTVAVSLHLSFLAVFLHFLLQLFLLLGRPALLLTGLPASLPVSIKTVVY